MWSVSDIADVLHEGLRHQAQLENIEQAVYGFDVLDELGLHPLLQNIFVQAGYGVWPEERYPDDRDNPKKSHGKRCDLVLTHDRLPLRDPEVRDTLFDDQPAVNPEDALWLEVKTVAQFTRDGPFPRYSAELLAPVPKDVQKLWNDSLIRHSALLLVLFTAEQAVAEHDLTAWQQRCLDRRYPIATPARRGFAISDRIGNGWCAIGVFGIRGC